MAKKSLKQAAISRLLLVFLAIVLVNIIGQRLFKRFDLTSEGRFSLSDSTIAQVSRLKEPVMIECYLDGDLRPDIMKFRGSIEDLLEELHQLSIGKVDYVFRNPNEAPKETDIKQYQNTLLRAGLIPTDLNIKTEDGEQKQTIFPGIIIRQGSKQEAVNLLNGTNNAMAASEIINASTEALEYEVVNGIRNVQLVEKPTVAFATGINGLTRYELESISEYLSKNYKIEFYDLGKLEQIPSTIKTLVIAKPRSPLSDWKKFKIDNFVMRGGNVLWCLDQINASLDSMPKVGYFMAGPYVNDASGNNLGFNDILFRYGIRINNDLVQDLKSDFIPIVIGSVGGRPNIQPRPWFYFPLATGGDNPHPIVKSIDPVQFRFASSIDLIETQNVTKTVLLTSSAQSRSVPAPIRVNLSLAANAPNPVLYNRPANLAVLLEGKFESIFHNRVLNEFAQKALDSLNFQILDSAIRPSRQIVISDGDVIANFVSKSGDRILPLGMNRLTQTTWGNRNFLMNCIDYLTDESGFIQVRGKEIKLRLLNKDKVKKKRLFYQTINVGLPILVLVLFGLLYSWMRKRKYAR